MQDTYSHVQHEKWNTGMTFIKVCNELMYIEIEQTILVYFPIYF